MANSTMYTRVYSKTSAGRLVSGKGQKAPFPYPTLSDRDLYTEFRNHAKKKQRQPTALVSTSVRIVDTLTRAFEMHYEDGEPQKDIWIVFIEVPHDDTTTQIYSAKELAQWVAQICELVPGEKYDLQEPHIYSHEFVFEWAIPENYLVHKVSLQTLVDRGLVEWATPEKYRVRGVSLQILVDRRLHFSKTTTQDVRQYIAPELRKYGLVEMGLALGFFAQMFGARAPVGWIARQLYNDCISRKVVPGCVDDGISMALYDWWLSDSEFLLAYEEFKAWPDMTEVDRIEDMIVWDLIDFWESWYFDRHGNEKKLSPKEKSSYERAKNELLAEHEKARVAVFEAEAVRIGL